VDDMISDLDACVEKAKVMPPEVSDSMNQTLASIDPATFSTETLNQMLGMAGIKGTALPERMAGINEMLNSLPAELSEKLLTEFLNELMIYRGA